MYLDREVRRKTSCHVQSDSSHRFAFFALTPSSAEPGSRDRFAGDFEAELEALAELEPFTELEPLTGPELSSAASESVSYA
jgi:hypothetical protein